MADVVVSVEGAKELRAAFRQAKELGLGGALKDSHRSIAELVVRRALPNVPQRTGRLRGSVRALASQRAARGRAGSARVPYAAAIHWGRRRGNVWGNKKGPNVIIGRPFLWEAAQDSRQEAMREYLQEIQRMLDRTVRNG